MPLVLRFRCYHLARIWTRCLMSVSVSVHLYLYLYLYLLSVFFCKGICICICMCTCIYADVCMHACMYVCMYACVYVSGSVCLCVSHLAAIGNPKGTDGSFQCGFGTDACVRHTRLLTSPPFCSTPTQLCMLARLFLIRVCGPLLILVV